MTDVQGTRIKVHHAQLGSGIQRV